MEKNGTSKLSQGSSVDIVNNFQRGQYFCHKVSSNHQTSEHGMASVKSAWNEGKYPDLHFINEPLAINIKTEEDI